MKKRPVGQITRGKTALNRLRQVDIYMLLAYEAVLRGGSPLIVDVGYGAYAWTALEMLARWQTVNPNLRLLGVEIDAERVANARPYAHPPYVDFQLGGFNLADILGSEKARVIRAYNVLRQYDESAVPDALHSLSQALAEGGILLEGTSTPSGGLVVFDVYRKENAILHHQEIVFGTNFHEPIALPHFQAILPKRLIHHMLDDRPAAFFEAWQKALALARGQGILNPRRQWVEAGKFIHSSFGCSMNTRKRILGRGFLAVRASLL